MKLYPLSYKIILLLFKFETCLDKNQFYSFKNIFIRKYQYLTPIKTGTDFIHQVLHSNEEVTHGHLVAFQTLIMEYFPV